MRIDKEKHCSVTTTIITIICFFLSTYSIDILLLRWQHSSYCKPKKKSVWLLRDGSHIHTDRATPV